MAFNEISSGAIVYRLKSGAVEYLILYKKAHDIYREQWNFPRGWIEKNESEKDTARREIEEETGIKNLDFIEGFREVIHFTYKRDGGLVSKKVIYYLARAKTSKVKLSFEHDSYGWFSFEDALKRLTYENDKKVLEKADAFLNRLSLDDFF